MKFIPSFKPKLSQKSIDEVVDTLKSGWITTGPKVQKFEKALREYIGCKHAITVNSCTSALHLSLVANGIGKGDEVITTPFTFISTVSSVMMTGAKPVLCDINRDDYNINSNLIEDKITDKTKAIIPVHYAGFPCNMYKIQKIAKQYDLRIIEDAAHALGATYKNRNIGTIGDTTCFSFYATKTLTTGEGGLVTTENDDVANKIRKLRLHGINQDAWKRLGNKSTWYYTVDNLGYKYNMTDIQAAIGLHQLKEYPEIQRRRRDIAGMYYNAFEKLEKEKKIKLPESSCEKTHAWYIYPIEVENRNKFISYLKKNKIGTGVHFPPIHKFNVFKDKVNMPITDKVFRHNVTIPNYPSLTNKQVRYIIRIVKEAIN